MAIVKRPKVNGIYYVSNKDLRLKNKNGYSILRGGHSVIVTSIDKKRRLARVKTITSVVEHSDFTKFNNRKLKDVADGNLLIIPIKMMNTKHLSAINHFGITIPLSKLQVSNNDFRFPNRYKNLIHRK